MTDIVEDGGLFRFGDVIVAGAAVVVTGVSTVVASVVAGVTDVTVIVGVGVAVVAVDGSAVIVAVVGGADVVAVSGVVVAITVVGAVVVVVSAVVAGNVARSFSCSRVGSGGSGCLGMGGRCLEISLEFSEDFSPKKLLLECSVSP